jgi:hypothetical protein
VKPRIFLTLAHGELLLSIGVSLDLSVKRFDEIHGIDGFLDWFREAVERKDMRIFF